LWAAARPGPVTAAVAVAPVADLARAHELRLSEGAVAEFLTGAGVAERIAEVDPVRLPPRVPVTVLHGTDDPDVPVELSRRYVAAHRDTGRGAPAVRELSGVGHYAAVTPGTAACGALVTALREASREERSEPRPTPDA
ncbi:alpha/beta hydrolase, partial [Streptomyces sp. NPDC000151]